MKLSNMEFDNSNDNFSNVLISVFLTIGTLLSKGFHFSLSAFTSQLMDISFGDAASYVDSVFHYTLLIVTLSFTSIKFYDYLKLRKK